MISQTDSENEFFEFSESYGNYDQEYVIKKLERNKKNIYLQRKRNNPEKQQQEDFLMKNNENNVTNKNFKKIINNDNMNLNEIYTNQNKKAKINENINSSSFIQDIIKQNHKTQNLIYPKEINLDFNNNGSNNINTISCANNSQNNENLVIPSLPSMISINSSNSTIPPIFINQKNFKKQNSYTNLEADSNMDSMIKEYLNIETFPSDLKEKVVILKKLAPLFKKIKDDVKRTGADLKKPLNFVEVLSEKLKEPIEDLKVK